MADAPSLRELQRQLLDLIRAAEGVDQGLAVLGLDGDDLAHVVAGDDRLSAIGRVAIYNDMYFFRLLDVLRGAFPKMLQVLGDDRFAALATDYLEAHPSRHPSLRYLGARLPAFMGEPARSRPHMGRLPRWSADLAALEWERYDVFDEADAPALTLAELKGLPAQQFASLPVRLVPAHRLVRTKFAVETAWRALAKEGSTTAPRAQARTLLVWRQDTMVYHRPVDEVEAAALELAQEGTTFGVLCERIASALALAPDIDAAEVATTAFRVLGRWAEDGLVRDSLALATD
jgi:hypothetical protein